MEDTKRMEYIGIADTGLRVSRIALGTWAIGGWMWGGADEEQSIATILAALDKGVTLVDTAPVYGFGTSERVVGKALAESGRRDEVSISTKCCLEWKDGKVFRNGSRDRVLLEVEDSLKRLRTDRLEILYVHWPDSARPIEETAAAVREVYEQGTVKAVGVSNFTIDQMRRFKGECPLHLCQPPYNIFERAVDGDFKAWCERNDVSLMTYGVLCRGLLSGKMRPDAKFTGDDLRQWDPKFQARRLPQYLAAVDGLAALAKDRYRKSLLAFAVRWVLERGVPVAIWGGRKPEQMEPLDEIFGWSLDLATMALVDDILAEHVKDPVSPAFMAPPSGVG
ncbi:NADP-dependent oxidoreductase domain containing protein [Desulfovibrio sp. X2]|uniref:aldo/keto reductase n=1 Tax=Desulfovibrio sp. X2 TaxID=941449 RepID=UPI0003588C8E|nr:aldo/keto reductase [Desulfovibrio sp. X2]EPR42155.1 NADP-dependent oxidoreductase domain containing protein [Desulfovibrio sp. X2]